jgi:hypothetical protein
MGAVPAISLFVESLLDTLRVKPDQDLVSDDNGRRGTAVIGSNQLEYCRLVHAYVLVNVLNSPLREEDLYGLARRSAGLSEE